MAVEQSSTNSAMEEFYRDIQAKGVDALWRTGGGGGGTQESVCAPYPPYQWRGLHDESGRPDPDARLDLARPRQHDRRPNDLDGQPRRAARKHAAAGPL